MRHFFRRIKGTPIDIGQARVWSQIAVEEGCFIKLRGNRQESFGDAEMTDPGSHEFPYVTGFTQIVRAALSPSAIDLSPFLNVTTPVYSTTSCTVTRIPGIKLCFCR